MAIEYHLRPERFRGTGTVFLAWDEHDLHYWGYWDSLPEADPHPLEEAPRTPSITDAVGWGRERTSRVLIRPESDPEKYYWAGLGEPTGGDAALERLAL